MNKADAKPIRDKAGLPGNHGLKQCQVGAFVGLGFGVMPSNDIVGKAPDGIGVPSRGKILESTDAHMAARHAGEQGPGKFGLPVDGLACGNRGERARGRDAQRVHALTDDVLPQNWPEPGPPVARTRKGCAPGTLELDIKALTLEIEDLTQ